ncbi:MAG: hypothetical protein H0U00_04075 [Actinobacteria bacterium]|nr:hypothetical protein [Actinomycetota bacterium]
MQRQHLVQERPLSPRDYDVPVGWWGWNWEPPVPMSVTELLEAGNFDARTAALSWMVLESHGSMLIAAEQPHSGKTTTLTAFLDFLPNDVRRVFIRGWSETFDYLEQTDPDRTLLLANELSSHLPVYLWGPKAVGVLRSLRQGYALGSTLHADSAEEAVRQLTIELGVARADLARVDLLAVMRVYATSRGGIARRLVSLHRAHGLVPLVEWDRARDEHLHHEDAQLQLLCERARRTADPSRLDLVSSAPSRPAARSGQAVTSLVDELRLELARRTEFLESLVDRGVREIPAARAALARFRGEPARTRLRTDQVS